MVNLLLTAFPILCLCGAFVYAALMGARLYKGSGFVSALAIAVVLAGLTLGRLIDRFVPLPGRLDDWVNYRGAAQVQISTQGDRYLAVLSVEVAVMFVLAAAVAFLAIALLKKDATRASRPGPNSLHPGILTAMFAFAVGLTARTKIAICLAYALARAHLL
jgi:hypothetical protein